jgi:cobalt-zinc-cadmium efflux system protein
VDAEQGSCRATAEGHASDRQALSAGGRHRTRLAIAVALIGGFFVAELVTALVSDSLALLSDAGHMAADVLTLAAALVATVVAARPDHSGRRSFGYYRVEVFASLLAVVVMLAVAVFVVLSAIGRFGHAQEVGTTAMMVVGALGLLVNLVVMLLLRRGAGESLNLKGAYLEVLADTVGSIGVIVAAVLVRVTGSALFDTLVALAIGVFVAVRAVLLGREVLGVLAQETPKHLDPEAIAQELGAIDGVTGVHDLHVWTLTSGMDVATAHLRVGPAADPHDVLDTAQQLLREQHGLDHCTVQIEPAGHSTAEESSW